MSVANEQHPGVLYHAFLVIASIFLAYITLLVKQINNVFFVLAIMRFFTLVDLLLFIALSSLLCYN